MRTIGKRKAMEAALKMTPEMLISIINRDERRDDEPSRLNPVLSVGRARKIFLAVAVEGKLPGLVRSHRRDDMVPSVVALAYANAIREFGLPDAQSAGKEE